MTGTGCGSHAGLGAELRAVAVLALDRLGPVLDAARAEPSVPASPVPRTAPGRRPQSPEVCAVCPVCAVVALLRGERPELGVRLAEHAAGLVAVLQAALHEGDPAARAPSSGGPAPDAPATDVPASDVPASDAPATDVPASDVPASDASASGGGAHTRPARPGPARRVQRIRVDRPAPARP